MNLWWLRALWLRLSPAHRRYLRRMESAVKAGREYPGDRLGAETLRRDMQDRAMAKYLRERWVKWP